MSLKLTIIENIIKLLAGGYIANALLFLRGIINASFMGPANYGIWRGLNLFSGYCTHAHLGVLNAMMLEIPVCYGKGEDELVAEIRNTAFTFMLFMIIIIGSISRFSSFAR